MKRIWNILLIQAALLASCTEKKAPTIQPTQVWNFEVEQADTLLRHTIDSIRFLPLQATDKSMLYGIDKLVVKDSLIYVGDFRAGKIAVYGMDGELKFILAQKGGGPQEYIEMKSFAIGPSGIYVLDNGHHVVNLYDKSNGIYMKTLKLPFVAWDMETLPDGHLIFAFLPQKYGKPNMTQENYRIFITDPELHIKKELLPYEEDEYEFIGRKTYFQPTSHGVLFNSPANETLYAFAGLDSVSIFDIRLSNGIPQEHRHDYEKVMEKGYTHLSSTPLWCKDYVTCLITGNEYMTDYLYDTKSKRLLTNDTKNAYKALLSPMACTGKCIVGVLDDYAIYQEAVKMGFTRADEKTESCLKNEGTVLLFYDMH